MKNKEVKRILAKALLMTVIVSNIGLTTITPAFAAETNMTQEAASTDNEAEQDNTVTDDTDKPDQDAPEEITSSKVVIRFENENADVKAFVDDQELTAFANENGSVSYEVENGKTLKIQINDRNDNTIQVTRHNTETGEEETLTPDENGLYCLDINKDETLTFTSEKEETKEDTCMSGHITTDVATSDDSEGFQWEASNAVDDLKDKSEQEMEEYTQEIIDEQNRAAAVPIDSVENPYANGSPRSEFEGLVSSLCSSLASGSPGPLAAWEGKTIYQLIFGSDAADQAARVNSMLDTLNSKSNQILDQLNQMEYRLEEIQKGVTDIKAEQKIQNIRADLNNVINYRVKVETLLYTLKTLDKNHTGSDRELGFYQDALRRLDNSTLKDVIDYGNALLTKGANTRKSSFYVVSELISLSDIGWETKMQEPQFYQNAELIVPYLEAASYITVLKEYELTKLQEGSAEYMASKNDIQIIKSQVNDIKKEMDKNKIESNRPAGTIAFYTKSGQVVLLSDKVRFQTDENNKFTYMQVTRKDAIKNWESLTTKGHRFTDYLLAQEERFLVSRKLEAANSCIQAAIGNNLATMDHDGLVGTDILTDLGFDTMYDTDTLTFLTSDCVEVKTNGKEKSFGVHTITLDANNKSSKGMTYFQYTDKNGTLLDKMTCDKKGFVSFMLNSVGSDDSSQSKYHRSYTVHNLM